VGLRGLFEQTEILHYMSEAIGYTEIGGLGSLQPFTRADSNKTSEIGKQKRENRKWRSMANLIHVSAAHIFVWWRLAGLSDSTFRRWLPY